MYTWPALGARVIVRDISVGRDGPRAEVWALDAVTGMHLHAGMVNLLSTSSKQTFVKALNARDSGRNWADIVEQFSVLAVEEYRQGDPLELLEPKRRPESGMYAIDPMAPLAQPTLWYGDGKTCKSYLLEACCQAMMTGGIVAGMKCARLTPAYLDWEWDKEEHEDRLLRLGGEAMLYYQRCTVPLAQQAKALRRKLDREGVDVIAVDSLGLACGGDPSDPDIALRFFSALRYLGRTAIIVHHVPKGGKDPYGSAYIRNSTRAGWYFARDAQPDEASATIAVVNRWSNVGKLQKARGLRFYFDDDAYATEIRTADARVVLKETGDLSLKERIMLELIERPNSAAETLADRLSVSANQIRARLSDLQRAGKAQKSRDELWYALDTDHAWDSGA